jgi:hypothetical protein
MILVCIFTPLKALVSSAVHRVARESCKRKEPGVRSQNPGGAERSKIVLVLGSWRVIGRCPNIQTVNSTRGNPERWKNCRGRGRRRVRGRVTWPTGRGPLVGRGSRTAETHNQRQEMTWISIAPLGLKTRRAAGLVCGREKPAVEPRLGRLLGVTGRNEPIQQVTSGNTFIHSGASPYRRSPTGRPRKRGSAPRGIFFNLTSDPGRNTLPTRAW